MTLLPRKSPRKPMKKSRIKRRPRKPSETLRIYGPKARREWMKTLPCSACGVVGYSEGAHVLGNGGMGRKADANTQAPLCRPHPVRTRNPYVALTAIGCHRLYDEYRGEFRLLFPDFDPAKVAADTEQAWQNFLTNQE